MRDILNSLYVVEFEQSVGSCNNSCHCRNNICHIGNFTHFLFWWKHFYQQMFLCTAVVHHWNLFCMFWRVWWLQGAIESISVGEIRLSLRQSLVKLGVGFISRDPKLQVLICDLEVVIRSSKKSTQKSRSKKPRSSGKVKWMVVDNMARFLSIF